MLFIIFVRLIIFKISFTYQNLSSLSHYPLKFDCNIKFDEAFSLEQNICRMFRIDGINIIFAYRELKFIEHFGECFAQYAD